MKPEIPCDSWACWRDVRGDGTDRDGQITRNGRAPGRSSGEEEPQSTAFGLLPPAAGAALGYAFARTGRGALLGAAAGAGVSLLLSMVSVEETDTGRVLRPKRATRNQRKRPTGSR